MLRNKKADADFRLLEKMLFQYPKIKKAVEEARAAMGYYNKGHPTGGALTSHAFISDPTASMGIKRTERIRLVVLDAGTAWEQTVRNPEDWLLVADQTLCCFRERGESEAVEIIKRRYFRNEPQPATSDALGVPKARYYELRDMCIAYARECAIQLGLIYVF